MEFDLCSRLLSLLASLTHVDYNLHCHLRAPTSHGEQVFLSLTGKDCIISSSTDVYFLRPAPSATNKPKSTRHGRLHDLPTWLLFVHFHLRSLHFTLGLSLSSARILYRICSSFLLHTCTYCLKPALYFIRACTSRTCYTWPCMSYYRCEPISSSMKIFISKYDIC